MSASTSLFNQKQRQFGVFNQWQQSSFRILERTRNALAKENIMLFYALLFWPSFSAQTVKGPKKQMNFSSTFLFCHTRLLCLLLRFLRFYVFILDLAVGQTRLSCEFNLLSHFSHAQICCFGHNATYLTRSRV